MSSPEPTHEDVERLVARSFETGEFDLNAQLAGLSQERVVNRLAAERKQIWETAARPLTELEAIKSEYAKRRDFLLVLRSSQQSAMFLNARAFIFVTVPLLLLSYFFVRYVSWARSAANWWVDLRPTVAITVLIVLAAAVSVLFVISEVRYLAYVGGPIVITLFLVYLAHWSPAIDSALGWLFKVSPVIAVLAGIMILGGCNGLYRHRKEALDNARYETVDDDPEIQSIQKKLQEQEQIVDETIITQGIKPRIREFIDKLLDLGFDTHLPRLDFSGLGEVFNSANEVATDAKTQLEFMVNTMPGGSIGIAGPRGSGKSTLLYSACKARPDNLTKRRVIPLLTSSPVEYDGRDFILHLFASICEKVLELTGRQDMSGPSLVERSRRTLSPATRILRVLSPLSVPALVLGSILIGLSVMLAVLTMNSTGGQEGAAALASPSPQSQSAASPVASARETPNAVATPATSAVAGTTGTPSPSPSPANQAATASRLARFLLALDLKPNIFFVTGLLLISLYGVLLFVRRHQLRFEDSATIRLEIEQRPLLLDLDLDQEIQARLAQAIKSARDWLHEIKFQQSYTTGWSGAIKMPIGLEGGVSDAITLAQKQLSLPDITKGFCNFVSGLGRDFKVIIGIDELDKLESDESAQRFLNEIKALFGLPNVFYLISVSENAMSNFERRGLPFRDVFDSSFDNIVYVDYLTLEYARRLIARRIVGMPPPFVHLCYCISGGLARDLVRTCRNLMQYSHAAHDNSEGGTDSSLRLLSNALIKGDLRLKLHALTVVAKKLNQTPALDSFLNKLQSLEAVLDSPKILLDTYTELLKTRQAPPAGMASAYVDDGFFEFYDRLQPTSAKDSRPDDTQAIAALHEELATYLYFCATLLQFFGEVLNPQVMTKAEEVKAFDELARARQYLSINASITRAMVDRFRQSFAMAVPQVARAGQP